MKISYDSSDDVLYITFVDLPAVRDEEIPGILVGRLDDKIVGLTFLSFSDTYANTYDYTWGEIFKLDIPDRNVLRGALPILRVIGDCTAGVDPIRFFCTVD